MPVIDLNNERTRGLLIVSVLVGMLSTVLIAGATVKGIKEMETVAFCGTVCHTVMEPEHTAFQRSPHSKITCADCHIGAGADWFVKSKISGSWQMVSVAFNLYPRPVTSPVHNLRPARDTCEQCHWPTKHVGDKLQVKTKFADDETNTETKTVLLMKVGGQQGSASTGIHWHVDRGVQIRYLSDPSRQKIYDIEMTTADGKKASTRPRPRRRPHRVAHDGLRGLPQPACAHLLPGRQGSRQRDGGRPHRQDACPSSSAKRMRVLQEGKYASKEEAKVGIAREVEKLLQDQLRRCGNGQGSADQGRRRGARRHLFVERVPEDEGHLGHPYEQPRATATTPRDVSAATTRSTRRQTGRRSAPSARPATPCWPTRKRIPEILKTLRP